MGTLRAVLRDLLLALGIGLAVGLALCLLFGLLGGLIGGAFYKGVVAARSAVLLAGGILLLFSFFLLLKGGNLPEEAFRLRLKKKRELEPDFQPPRPLNLYRVVARPYTTLATAAGILLVSLLPDLLLIHL